MRCDTRELHAISSVLQRMLDKTEKAEQRHKSILHLAANENVLTPLVRRVLCSTLSDRYLTSTNRSGVEIFDDGFSAASNPELGYVLDHAEQVLQRRLEAQRVSIDCLSGIHAMMCALIGTTNVGDTVMTVPLNQGGHFCTEGVLRYTGRKQVYTEYDFDNYTIDVEKTAQEFIKHQARALYLDSGFLLNPHPIEELREALGTNAIIIYDASHPLGYIMQGEFQSPLKEGADVICSNTHKSFPGPHRGLLAFRENELFESVSARISKSLYSSTHLASQLSLAFAVCEFESYGQRYVTQCILNTEVLGYELTKRGLSVRRADTHRFTYSHQLHIYTGSKCENITKKFIEQGVSLNTSLALGSEQYIRVGLQEVTMKGAREADMKTIADIICQGLSNTNTTDLVKEFVCKFPEVVYGF